MNKRTISGFSRRLRSGDNSLTSFCVIGMLTSSAPCSSMSDGTVSLSFECVVDVSASS